MKLSLKALTIYPKLVLSFLLMIIPIYVSSLMMNRSGEDVVRKQISESMASRVHFYLTSLETEFSRLTRLKVEYVNDDDLLTLGTAAERMNDFERSRTILAVKSKLYLFKSTSPFVGNVKLYIPALGRSVIANDYDDSIPEDELDAMLEPDNMKSPVFEYEGKLMMTGVYPDAIYVNRKPVLAMGIELSKAEISRTLNSIVTGEQGARCCWAPIIGGTFLRESERSFVRSFTRSSRKRRYGPKRTPQTCPQRGRTNNRRSIHAGIRRRVLFRRVRTFRSARHDASCVHPHGKGARAA